MTSAYKVADIRAIFGDKDRMREFVTDKTGVQTIEILNASFIADEPIIFGEANNEYVERELEWYHLQSLYVHDIPPPVPEIWKRVASKTGRINSNYGWCIFSEQNGNQFNNVLNELTLNPDSRRATMIYTRPSMHTDYKVDGMSDFMCTNAVQYLIRDNKLHTLVYMRSNDVVFGYKNDYAWQNHVRNELLNRLNDAGKGYTMGNMYWNVSSLHMYERHFYLVAQYNRTGQINISKQQYREFYPHCELGK